MLNKQDPLRTAARYLNINIEAVFLDSNFIGGSGIRAIEFAISFSNIPTTLIFITKGKHSFQNTLSQTSFATATLVGNAVEFPFGLEQAKHITIQIHEAGQGVALLDDVEAADSLAANRLVRVSDIESPAGEYVIVQSTLTPETAVMVTVKAWLRSEMDKFNEQHTDHQALHKTGKQKTVGSPN